MEKTTGAKKSDKKSSSNSIKEEFKKLQNIVEWFEKQTDLDIDLALENMRVATAIIKNLNQQLKYAENEFLDLQKELEAE